MIGNVQSFITPQQSAFYLSPDTLRNVAQSLDQDRNRFIDRDELQLSAQLLRRVDTNRDNRIQLSELESALSRNELSIRNLSYGVAEEMARTVIGEWAYTAALGSLGQSLDSNYDGRVTRGELSVALNRGDVALSGAYLVGMSHHQDPPYYPIPGQPHPIPGHPNHPGHGEDVGRAREFINSLESNKMKKDRWGNYDPSTGIFKPEEANQKIKTHLENTVIPSQAISYQDKLALIDSQKMKLDRWGNYDPAVGSLTGKEASLMALKSLDASRHDEYDPGYARQYVQDIAGTKMQKDRWGNNDYTTGLLTDIEANNAIKKFLREFVVHNRAMTQNDKLDLFRAQLMQKDRWGNYDPMTGSLTASEVQELSKQVFRG